jgi:hypothetical protein
MATVDLLMRAMMLVAAAAVSVSAAGASAGSTSCTTALGALCGGQRHTSVQACAVCCGRHQQPLRQAACSRADCDAFCAAGGGGGPPADPGYDHQVRKMPSWSTSLANFSLLWLYSSFMTTWANLRNLGQPNAVHAPDAAVRREPRRGHGAASPGRSLDVKVIQAPLSTL